MTERTIGKVKWFNGTKGYGFISQDDGPDVFVHYSAIRGNGFRNLTEGDRVEFTVQNGPKGLQASDVVRVEGRTPFVSAVPGLALPVGAALNGKEQYDRRNAARRIV